MLFDTFIFLNYNLNLNYYNTLLVWSPLTLYLFLQSIIEDYGGLTKLFVFSSRVEEPGIYYLLHKLFMGKHAPKNRSFELEDITVLVGCFISTLRFDVNDYIILCIPTRFPWCWWWFGCATYKTKWKVTDYF